MKKKEVYVDYLKKIQVLTQKPKNQSQNLNTEYRINKETQI